MQKPKVSIVIPCYNHGGFLAEAVNSVDALKRQDVELIIVDDGSTEEDTKREIDRYIKAAYHVIRQPNGGLARARNAGIKVARGDYILPLDADNRIRPEYIENGTAILDRNSRVGVVYSDAEYFGESTGRWHMGYFDEGRLLKHNYIDACALYRKEVWEQNNGYDPHMPAMGFEDWDFWLGALKHGWAFAYIEKILWDYRVRTNSMFTQAIAHTKETEDYVACKHGVLYRLEMLALQRRTRSIKATTIHLLSLLKFRLLHPSQHRTVVDAGRGQPKSIAQ